MTTDAVAADAVAADDAVPTAAPAAAADPPLLDLHPEPGDFLGEVLAGLGAEPRTLPCKYFYDERGSRLFDRICELEEYYPTRTEISILEARGDEMAAAIGPRVLLVEPGSGSSFKTRLLLDRLEDPVGYVPIDISGEHLLAAARIVQASYPGLEVLPVCADYTREIPLPTPRRTPRRAVAYFPGSTIGNFEPREASDFLATMGRLVGTGGGLLLGFDLEKEREILERAYDDREGVTADFNRNLLRRIRDELGGAIDPDGFAHRALWNADEGRVEMHLVARGPQRIHIGDREFLLAAGESIHTESSYKYTRPGMERLAAAAGWKLRDSWVDDGELFCVGFFERR